MDKIKYLLIVLIFIPLISGASSIGYRIDKIIQDTNPNLNIGIKIVNLKTNKLIYKRNAASFFNWGSGLKVLTAASAIEFFGEDYLFSSKLFKHGENYYLDIGDNPDFSDKDLNTLLSKLTGNIQGNFYIVKKDFDLTPINPYKFHGDGLYCYGAPITRTHINKNCFPLTVKPGKHGGKAILNTPHKGLFKITNNTNIIKDNSRKPRIQRFVEGNNIKIIGTLNESSSSFSINPVIENNINYLSLFIKQFLQKNNIKLHGKILPINKLPKGLLISESKKDIKTLLKQVLQKSDNFVSDYLFQLMTNNKVFEEWFECGEYLRLYAEKRFKIDLNNAVIIDGSGLSRLNMLTPDQMSSLLEAIYKKPYFSNFKKYLAQPGYDSTLKDRFVELPYKINNMNSKQASGIQLSNLNRNNISIYAKTGSLKGISSLVGYLEHENDIYSFCIVSNNGIAPKKSYAQLEEAVIGAIIQP